MFNKSDEIVKVFLKHNNERDYYGQYLELRWDYFQMLWKQNNSYPITLEELYDIPFLDITEEDDSTSLISFQPEREDLCKKRQCQGCNAIHTKWPTIERFLPRFSMKDRLLIALFADCVDNECIVRDLSERAIRKYLQDLFREKRDAPLRSIPQRGFRLREEFISTKRNSKKHKNYYRIPDDFLYNIHSKLCWRQVSDQSQPSEGCPILNCRYFHITEKLWEQYLINRVATESNPNGLTPYVLRVTGAINKQNWQFWTNLQKNHGIPVIDIYWANILKVAYIGLPIPLRNKKFRDYRYVDIARHCCYSYCHTRIVKAYIINKDYEPNCKVVCGALPYDMTEEKFKQWLVKQADFTQQEDIDALQINIDEIHSSVNQNSLDLFFQNAEDMKHSCKLLKSMRDKNQLPVGLENMEIHSVPDLSIAHAIIRTRSNLAQYENFYKRKRKFRTKIDKKNSKKKLEKNEFVYKKSESIQPVKHLSHDKVTQNSEITIPIKKELDKDLSLQISKITQDVSNIINTPEERIKNSIYMENNQYIKRNENALIIQTRNEMNINIVYNQNPIFIEQDVQKLYQQENTTIGIIQPEGNNQPTLLIPEEKTIPFHLNLSSTDINSNKEKIPALTEKEKEKEQEKKIRKELSLAILEEDFPYNKLCAWCSFPVSEEYSHLLGTCGLNPDYKNPDP